MVQGKGSLRGLYNGATGNACYILEWGIYYLCWRDTTTQSRLASHFHLQDVPNSVVLYFMVVVSLNFNITCRDTWAKRK